MLVLEELRDSLGKSFDITISAQPLEALELLETGEPFAVVVSDMQMPQMNGATFLAAVRIKAPDTTRVLLTGNAQMTDAINAVNRGEIFRFLTKPCHRDVMIPVLAAAAEQHRLALAERVLLEDTLRGCVQTFAEVTSFSNPRAYGRASRTSDYATRLAMTVHAPSTWEVETAALLSQLAASEATDDILIQAQDGGLFNEEARRLVQSTPKLSGRYLRHIPRFELVAEILDKQALPAGQLPEADPSSLYAKIFRISHDFELLETCGSSPKDALMTLRGRGDLYDEELLDVFGDVCVPGSEDGGVISELSLPELSPGMRLTQNVSSAAGTLLITKRQVLTGALLRRLRDLPAGYVQEPITVRVAASDFAVLHQASILASFPETMPSGFPER